MVSDPIDDAISAMHDAVFSDEEYKKCDVQRDALYWRLEDILTWWAAEGVDITALLEEFKEIMTERKEIWHSSGSRDKQLCWQALCSIYNY